MKNSRHVIVCVAAYFHESPETLTGPSRYTSATIPRYVAMKLIRENLHLSLQQIGRVFHRTHSTVYSGMNHLDTVLAKRPDLACNYNELQQRLFGTGSNTEESK